MQRKDNMLMIRFQLLSFSFPSFSKKPTPYMYENTKNINITGDKVTGPFILGYINIQPMWTHFSYILTFGWYSSRDFKYIWPYIWSSLFGKTV